MSAWAESMLEALRNPNARVHFGFEFNGQPSRQPCPIFIGVPQVEERVLSQHCRPDSKILDIGCGVGRHPKWIHQRYPEAKLWATESDPTLREHCNALGYIEIFSSLTAVTEQDFDLVLLLGGNIGLGGTEAGLRRLLSDIFSKMTPGGILLAEGSSPFGEPFTGGTAIISYNGHTDDPFQWCFCSESWFRKEALLPAGFIYLTTTRSAGGYIVAAEKPKLPAPANQ